VKNEMKKERKSLAKKGKSSEAKIMERKAWRKNEDKRAVSSMK
jgi:hypothetical protein